MVIYKHFFFSFAFVVDDISFVEFLWQRSDAISQYTTRVKLMLRCRGCDVDRAVYNAHLNNCLIYISSEKSFRERLQAFNLHIINYKRVPSDRRHTPAVWAYFINVSLLLIQLIKGVRYLKAAIIHYSLLVLNYLYF